MEIDLNDLIIIIAAVRWTDLGNFNFFWSATAYNTTISENWLYRRRIEKEKSIWITLSSLSSAVLEGKKRALCWHTHLSFLRLVHLKWESITRPNYHHFSFQRGRCDRHSDSLDKSWPIEQRLPIENFFAVLLICEISTLLSYIADFFRFFALFFFAIMALSNMGQTSLQGHPSSVQKGPKFQSFRNPVFSFKTKFSTQIFPRKIRV